MFNEYIPKIDMHTKKKTILIIVFSILVHAQTVTGGKLPKLRLIPKKHSTKAFNKLHNAINAEDAEKVRDILSRHNIKLNKSHNDDMTALQRAIERGNFDIIKHLVYAGADVNIPEGNAKKLFFFTIITNTNTIRTHTIQNKSGVTPLFTAVCNHDFTTTQFLLEHGARFDPNGNDTVPLLLAAVIQKDCEITQLLIDYGLPINNPIKHRDGHKHTLLSLAAAQGHIKMLKLLLKNGANVNGNKNTHSPLIVAVKHNYKLITQTLIRHRASVNTTDNKGNSPLHFVKSIPCAQLLINHGANINLQDKYMQTPLHKAAFGGFFNIVCILIRSGSNTQARDTWNVTAMDKAYIMGNNTIADYIAHTQNKYNKIKASLEAQPTQKLLQNNKSFALYSYIHHKNMLPNIIQSYIVPQKWILYAIRCHHGEIFKLLCQQQYILSEINKPKAIEGNAAIHIVTRYHDTDMLSYLMKHGANPIQINNYKKTPYDIAKKYENEEAGKILVKLYTIANIFNHARNQYAKTKTPPIGMIPPEITEYIIRYI